MRVEKVCEEKRNDRDKWGMKEDKPVEKSRHSERETGVLKRKVQRLRKVFSEAWKWEWRSRRHLRGLSLGKYLPSIWFLRYLLSPTIRALQASRWKSTPVSIACLHSQRHVLFFSFFINKKSKVPYTPQKAIFKEVTLRRDIYFFEFSFSE